jgi:hypothetical protein
VEEFMEDLHSYLHLNARVPPLNTYQGKVNFSLTLIKGKQVRDFVREQGDIVDASIEALDTWLDFLNAFDARFLDSQCDTGLAVEL